MKKKFLLFIMVLVIFIVACDSSQHHTKARISLYSNGELVTTFVACNVYSGSTKYIKWDDCDTGKRGEWNNGQYLFEVLEN